MASDSKPKATKQDIENYLNLLTEDVGHQHLPYDAEDTRHATGKADMRKGMTFYLGAHLSHEAKLTSITTGLNVIVLKYDTRSVGVRPDTKEKVSFEYYIVEVLEVENGKVSVIRKYSE